MSKPLLALTALIACACSAPDSVAKEPPLAQPTEEATQAGADAVDPLAYTLPADKNEMVTLEWADLLPPGEDERIAAMYQQQLSSLFGAGPIAEGSADDVATQIGTFNTVGALDGHKVRIPGYIVPFEFGKDAKIKEFLLVPYFGACLHAPPPPPNQTIYVTTDKPMKLKDLAQAVWAEGYISTQNTYNDLGNTAYTLKLTKQEEYDF